MFAFPGIRVRATSMKLLRVLAVTFAIIAVSAAVSYDQNYAKLALYYSASAYCDTDVVSDWSCLSCGYIPSFELVEVAYDPNLNIFGYIGFDSSRDLSTITYIKLTIL